MNLVAGQSMRHADVEVRAVGKNPGVVLRSLRPDQVTDAYVDGMNDSRVGKHIVASRARVHTTESIRDWVEQNWNAQDAVVLGIYVDDRHVGNVRLHDIGPDSAMMGIAIFDANAHGQGLGSQVIAAAARYALSDLLVQEVRAGIDPENHASQRAFTTAGFEPSSEFSRNCCIWTFSKRSMGSSQNEVSA